MADLVLEKTQDSKFWNRCSRLNVHLKLNLIRPYNLAFFFGIMLLRWRDILSVTVPGRHFIFTERQVGLDVTLKRDRKNGTTFLGRQCDKKWLAPSVTNKSIYVDYGQSFFFDRKTTVC